MLSPILLPGTKAVWELEIIESRISLSLAAISLEIHLQVVLQQEIGLKSLMVLGFGTLGIKAIVVELVPLRRLPCLKKD